MKRSSTARYLCEMISKELMDTAMGVSYYGNALRVAKDMPCVTAEDRSILDKYATRTNQCGFSDRMILQDIAIKVKNFKEKE